MTTTLIITSVLLIIITLQDLKDRAVSWLCFPVVFICGLCMSANEEPFPTVLKSTTTNMLLLGFQLLLLTVYFSVRKKKVKEMIGLGDILFLISVCTYFSVGNFLFFYIVSIFFSILLFFVFNIFKRIATIPMAGFQSMFLLLAINSAVYFQFNITSDDWIFNKLLISV